MYHLDLFEGRGEMGQHDLGGVECLWMIRLLVGILMFYPRVLNSPCVFTSSQICTYNPVGGLCWRFFCRDSQHVKAIGSFGRGALLLMFGNSA